MWTTSPERSRAFWTSVYDRMLAELGVAGCRRARDQPPPRVHAAWRTTSCSTTSGPTIATLRGRGLLLGIVSNFEAWLEEWFGVHELVETFPVRVISGIEGIEKPDPRIFRLALERAGVDAAESAYVGDNPEFDVDPPAALGMFPVLVDRRDRFPDHAGARVRDLRDLPAILEAA